MAEVVAPKEKERDPGEVPVFLTPVEPKEPKVGQESSPAKNVEPLIRIPWRKNLAEHGAEILEKSGEFPPIVARYERLGFKAYLSTITAQAGARVFLDEVQRRRLVAEVIPQDGELKPVGPLAGLAVQRPRIITDPGVAEFIHKAREQFGPGDYQMVVLFPAATESWIVGGLAQRMKENGIDPPSISCIETCLAKQPVTAPTEILRDAPSSNQEEIRQESAADQPGKASEKRERGRVQEKARGLHGQQEKRDSYGKEKMDLYPRRLTEHQAEGSPPIYLTILRKGDTHIIDLASVDPLIPRSETQVEKEFLDEICAEMERVAALYASGRFRGVGSSEAREAGGLVSEMQGLGRLIFSHLLTQPARERLKNVAPCDLYLRLDDQLVQVPWELCFDGKNFLATTFRIGRQVITQYAGRRSEPFSPSSSRDREKLKILIIADPTESLPGVTEEVEQLCALLDRVPYIEVTLLGGKGVRKIPLLSLLGRVDVVHFAGHSVFNAQEPRDNIRPRFGSYKRGG